MPKPSEMRRDAAYLRHLSTEAKRVYVEPTTTRDEASILATMDEYKCTRLAALAYDPEADFEPIEPLHVRLRSAANALVAAAAKLEPAIDEAEYADDLYRDVLTTAKRADWYDDAYEGFCESMAAPAEG